MARRRPRARPEALDDAMNRPTDAFAEDRQLRAYRLWVLGYTYREIASKLGYGSHTTAIDAVKRQRGKVAQRDNRALVAQQADRIEYAIHVVLDAVETWEPKDKLWAIDRLGPLFKRQSELLGLDAAKEAAEAAKVIIREVPAGLLPAPKIVDAVEAESVA